jgi:hypothetical protein
MPISATATNKPSSDDHVTDFHTLDSIVLLDHVIPSGEVAASVVPPYATATKRFNSGDHVTEYQLLAAMVLFVHVIPSGDVAAL